MQLHFLLLLWYSTTIVDGDTHIQPIPSNSGLYFEDIGEILISENSWKLIIYRNLEPLFIARDSIKRLVNNYQFLITPYSVLPSVITTTSYIKLSLAKIDSRLEEINFYIENQRIKRELLDGLGTVLKWLIGTPDAKDAIYYDECISKLENQQLSANHILKQQLQIISSTITNFNQTILKISYDERIINENLANINSYVNTTNKLIFNLTISEEISTVSIQIIEALTSLEKDIDDIVTSILLIKSGAIHPSIISTMRLYKELLASNAARPSQNLVAQITLKNIHIILESATIISYIYMNKLIYVLEFPLVGNERFNLFHIYSIPIRSPDSSLYSTILPEQTYLAMSTTRQQYITTSLLTKCKDFTTKAKICKDLPIYNINTRPICEVQILTSASTNVPETCDVTTFSARINTFQALKNNNWIYIVQHNTPYALECKGKTTHGEISGAGIISLEQGCKMYTALVTLLAEEPKSMNITHPVITVDIENVCIQSKIKLERPDLLPIKLNSIPLDSLNSIKEQIKIHSKLLHENQPTFYEKHTAKFSLMGAVIGLIMLSYLCIKCCKYIPSCRPSSSSHQDGCIQIFNNCFDRSQRRQHIEIPMTSLNATTTSCVSEDEEEISPSQTPQKSSNSAQSLF